MIDNNARATALTVALHSMAVALTRAASVGPQFTCSEADALTQVLALSGHVEEAATFLARHALGDDEVDIDRHHGVTSIERAHAYIRDLFDVVVADPGQARHPVRTAHLALLPADRRSREEDEESDSPEVEAMAAESDLVEQGEYDDIEIAHQMMEEIAQQDASLPDGPAGDVIDLLGVDAEQMVAVRANGLLGVEAGQMVAVRANGLLGVEAGQMIAARSDADAALANRDHNLLVSTLERMGMPAEDGPDLLAQALLAAPPAAQRRQLDQIEILNTLDRDQPAVLAHQRTRTGTGPSAAASKRGHPASVAAAAVDQPTDAPTQRHRANTRAGDVGRRETHPRSASTDRRSTPQR